MADSTVTEEEVLEDAGVETEQSEDETPEQETPSTADDAEETDEAEEPEGFQKRFTQFKGETPEEYLQHLEDAYGHSTTEATRLSTERKDLQQRLDQIASLVANDPDLAAKLGGQTDPKAPPANPLVAGPVADPRLAFAVSQVEQQWEREYREFVDQHRELQTDQTLNQELIDTLGVVSQAMQQRKGRTPSMAEGLKLAWTAMGKPLLDNNEEDIRVAAKQSAAQSKAPVGRPTAPPEPEQFTKAQLDFAKRAWPELNKDDLVKKLSEYVQ